MDARTTPRWALALLVGIVAGCTFQPTPAPSARDEQAQSPEPPEPPQVVEAEPAPAVATQEDEVQSAVLGFIERVDAAGHRSSAWQISPPNANQGLRFAADEEPTSAPTTRPAEESPVVILAESDPLEQPTSAPSSDNPLLNGAQTAETQPALEAPSLIGVNVHAAPALQTSAPGTATPGINTPAEAMNGPTSLQGFLDTMVFPKDPSFGQQLDLRVLRVVAGDYERAREPLTLVTAEQQELAARFVDALIAVREGHMGDLATAARNAGEALDELRTALSRISELNMPVLTICSAVRGYGQYDEIEPARFRCGTSEFVLYCEIRDFVSEHRPDGFYYTTFDMTTAILNRIGDTVLEIRDVDISDRCRNHRHDCFIPRLVRLPPSLSPGQYVAKVTVVDKLGKKVAENSAPFELAAQP